MTTLLWAQKLTGSQLSLLHIKHWKNNEIQKMSVCLVLCATALPTSCEQSRWQEISFWGGGYSRGGLGTEAPRGVQGRRCDRKSGTVPQKLKQFADIVCRFWLQKRSKFENFAQLGAKRHVWGVSPSNSWLAPPLAVIHYCFAYKNCT